MSIWNWTSREWSICAVVCILAFTFSETTRAEDKSALIITPTTEEWAVIAYNLAGVEPPFKTWAESDDHVQALDEFKRAQAAKALEERIREQSQRVKDVRFVKLSVNTEFGPYNDRYNEFDFNINDGSMVNFLHPWTFGKEIEVRLINGGLAQTWPLTPAEAEKVLNLINDNRNVTLNMKLELVKASASVSQNEPLTIYARIVEYDIVSARKGLRLGHVVVK